jgi:hypothetical protein
VEGTGFVGWMGDRCVCGGCCRGRGGGGKGVTGVDKVKEMDEVKAMDKVKPIDEKKEL